MPLQQADERVSQRPRQPVLAEALFFRSEANAIRERRTLYMQAVSAAGGNIYFTLHAFHAFQ